MQRPLPEDLAEALSNGVILCQLANQLRPRSVPFIHVPSPAVVSWGPGCKVRNGTGDFCGPFLTLFFLSYTSSQNSVPSFFLPLLLCWLGIVLVVEVTVEKKIHTPFLHRTYNLASSVQLNFLQ